MIKGFHLFYFQEKRAIYKILLSAILISILLAFTLDALKYAFFHFCCSIYSKLLRNPRIARFVKKYALPKRVSEWTEYFLHNNFDCNLVKAFYQAQK